MSSWLTQKGFGVQTYTNWMMDIVTYASGYAVFLKLSYKAHGNIHVQYNIISKLKQPNGNFSVNLVVTEVF